MSQSSSILDNFLTVAVWGSLASSLLLSTFLFLQAAYDKERRGRFALFAMICLLIACIDFVFSQHLFDFVQYEALRIVVWSLQPAALVYLVQGKRVVALFTALLILCVGTLSWIFIDPTKATTCVIPLAFAVTTLIHTGEYVRSRGYASCLLAAHSAAISLMCALYAEVMATGNPQIIGLGYLHYVTLSLFSVFLGWVNLPRELRGKSPVKISPLHAFWYVSTIFITEILIQCALLEWFSWPPTWFLIMSAIQGVASLVLFLHYRHTLVIFTDNVVELLEERTASLRAAQNELSHQNEIQAERLDEQARELKLKASVIERQRRVELAAQTAGQVAHDIQNLISPMVAHLEKIDSLPEIPATAHVSLDVIKEQVKDLLELNAQLLTLSRRGRMSHSAQRVDLLTQEVLTRFSHAKLSALCEPVGWIQGARGQITRALTNLITNALEAIDPVQGEVVVKTYAHHQKETRLCHLGVLTPGHYVCIAVSDNGHGIPQEYIDRIFEPYFSSKEGERSGSGLGLTIVGAVADDHGAVVDVHSSREGTSFVMYFPEFEPHESDPRSVLCENETVLVLEDDSAMRTQTEKILEEAGYAVVTASSGREALEVLQMQEIALIVMDQNLPDHLGTEILFAAQNLRPGTRAVLYSMHLPRERAQEAKLLGARVVLTKPATPDELLRAVKRALSA